MKLDFVLLEDLYEKGKKHYLVWDTDKAPHVAVSGITGSGKTFLVKLILARISKHIPDSQITICDFKGDNGFSYLADCENFYKFTDFGIGFKDFYESFLHRQQNNKSNNFRLILLEEWAGYINYLDRKEAEDARKCLAYLLMLSRSYNYHILLSQQRLDAEYFGKSRDNFNVIVTLGNSSKEASHMLFSEFKDEIKPDRQRGTGYMLTNGADLHRIIVPLIVDMDLVDEYIKQAVLR